MIRVFVILFLVFLLECTVNADNRYESELSISILKVFSEITKEVEINKIISKGFLNSDQTAMVISIPGQLKSQIYIFIKQIDGSYISTDISQVEDRNLGKLGRNKQYYDRTETFLTRWLNENGDYYQINIRTHAWKDGHRYTVSETLIIF